MLLWNKLAIQKRMQTLQKNSKLIKRSGWIPFAAQNWAYCWYPSPLLVCPHIASPRLQNKIDSNGETSNSAMFVGREPLCGASATIQTPISQFEQGNIRYWRRERDTCRRWSHSGYQADHNAARAPADPIKTSPQKVYIAFS